MVGERQSSPEEEQPRVFASCQKKEDRLPAETRASKVTGQTEFTCHKGTDKFINISAGKFDPNPKL